MLREVLIRSSPRGLRRPVSGYRGLILLWGRWHISGPGFMFTLISVFEAETEVWFTSVCFLDVNSSRSDWKASNIDAWKEPICCCIWMFSELPRDFSRFVSILCCKAVPGVGGTVWAGVLSDKKLKGRGWGRGGGGGGGGGGGWGKKIVCSTLKVCIWTSERIPVAFTHKIKFIIFCIRSVRLLFLYIAFPVLNFFHLVICDRCTDITGRFKGDTGVITLARFPTSSVNQRKNKNGSIFVLLVCLYSFDGWTF